VSTPRRVVVEADGGSRGNPGPAGYGAVVRDAATAEVLAERRGALGVATNNVAEYRGLIAGLEAARDVGASAVLVRMDSKLVVEQMSGRWQVKHPALRPLASQAATLRSGFDDVRFEWIPRERNRHADRLANEAMDSAAGSRRLAAPAVSGSWAPPAGTPTRLVLLRHGATEHSAEHRFSGRNALPLTSAGRAQAGALARRAVALGEVASVVSSPLLRAQQTASAVADALSVPIRTDDGLAEVDFGEWEGLTYAEIEQGWPAELGDWYRSPDVPPPSGESMTDATARVRQARNRIVASSPGRTTIVVSHVTPIKILLRLALDAPPATIFRLHLDLASMSILDLFDDGVSSVRLVNDTNHVDGLHQVITTH
jgi:ribonuclease H / adenosylcobalamin/alpha-ribazole phosphatase